MTRAAVRNVSSTPRNLLLNSDFNLWQRGTAFTNVASIPMNYQADRWNCTEVSNGTIDVAQSSDVPAGSKSAYSILVTRTSGATLASSTAAYIRQKVEGYIFRPYFGLPLYATFNIKTSFTGTLALYLQNGAADQSIVFPFNVVANTWTEINQAIPANPTTGTWNLSSGIGITAGISFMAGTDYQTSTTGSWISGDKRGTAACSQFMINASVSGTPTIQVSDFSLTQSVSKIPFRRRFDSDAEEIFECMRYYETGSFAIAGYFTAAQANENFISFKVVKRAVGTSALSGGAGEQNLSSKSLGTPTIYGVNLDIRPTSTGYVRSTSLSWSVDAEL